MPSLVILVLRGSCGLLATSTIFLSAINRRSAQICLHQNHTLLAALVVSLICKLRGLPPEPTQPQLSPVLRCNLPIHHVDYIHYALEFVLELV